MKRFYFLFALFLCSLPSFGGLTTVFPLVRSARLMGPFAATWAGTGDAPSCPHVYLNVDYDVDEKTNKPYIGFVVLIYLNSDGSMIAHTWLWGDSDSPPLTLTPRDAETVSIEISHFPDYTPLDPRSDSSFQFFFNLIHPEKSWGYILRKLNGGQILLKPEPEVSVPVKFYPKPKE